MTDNLLTYSELCARGSHPSWVDREQLKAYVETTAFDEGSGDH